MADRCSTQLLSQLGENINFNEITVFNSSLQNTHHAMKTKSLYLSSDIVFLFYNFSINLYKYIVVVWRVFIYSWRRSGDGGANGTTTSDSPCSKTNDSNPASCISKNLECSSKRSLIRIRCSTFPRLQ